MSSWILTSSSGKRKGGDTFPSQDMLSTAEGTWGRGEKYSVSERGSWGREEEGKEGGRAGDGRKRGEGEVVPEMKSHSLRCQVVNRGGQTRLTFVKYM